MTDELSSFKMNLKVSAAAARLKSSYCHTVFKLTFLFP